MAWHISDPLIGSQGIEDTETTQNHELGKIVRATDPTYGSAEFIYLLGVASTAAGDWVTYNPDDFSTTRLAANAIGPVAIAMAANVADQYGWYMIHGKHPEGACLTGLAENAQVWITGTAGAVDDTSVAGDLVNNAKSASSSVADSGVAEFEIARPWVDNNSNAG